MRSLRYARSPRRPSHLMTPSAGTATDTEEDVAATHPVPTATPTAQRTSTVRITDRASIAMPTTGPPISTAATIGRASLTAASTAHASPTAASIVRECGVGVGAGGGAGKSGPVEQLGA